MPVSKSNLGPMELIPPSLTDIGHVLWGPGWEPVMAAALEVADEDVQDWITDPTKMPADIEDRLQQLGTARISEIGFFMIHVRDTGISRKPENADG